MGLDGAMVWVLGNHVVVFVVGNPAGVGWGKIISKEDLLVFLLAGA